jgi:fatty acid-binding protein DegV
VDNTDGSMAPGKKYRGKLGSVILHYIQDKLDEYGDSIDTTRAFITHSGIDDETLALAREYLAGHSGFQEIHATIASCTISAHCGPNTLGVLFMTK